MSGLIQPGNYGFRLCITKNAAMVLDISMDGVKDTENAKRMLQRALEEYFPSEGQEEDALCGVQEENAAGQAVPPVRTSGVKGAMMLRCKACGKTFGTFLKEPKREFLCNCGQCIDLTGNLDEYRYVCPGCGQTRYGKTNLEDAVMEDRCSCGSTAILTWDPEERRYVRKENRPRTIGGGENGEL